MNTTRHCGGILGSLAPLYNTLDLLTFFKSTEEKDKLFNSIYASIKCFNNKTINRNVCINKTDNRKQTSGAINTETVTAYFCPAVTNQCCIPVQLTCCIARLQVMA